MRYTGPNRSIWPLLATAVLAVLVIIAVYLLFFQPR